MTSNKSREDRTANGRDQSRIETEPPENKLEASLITAWTPVAAGWA